MVEMNKWKTLSYKRYINTKIAFVKGGKWDSATFPAFKNKRRNWNSFEHCSFLFWFVLLISPPSLSSPPLHPHLTPASSFCLPLPHEFLCAHHQESDRGLPWPQTALHLSVPITPNFHSFLLLLGSNSELWVAGWCFSFVRLGDIEGRPARQGKG